MALRRFSLDGKNRVFLRNDRPYGLVLLSVPGAYFMPIYFVYMVRCADDSLYCGITTHPARRLRQHNGELSGGGRYTRSRRPVRFVACRTCADKGEALSLEARLKKLPRHRKLEALYRAFQL